MLQLNKTITLFFALFLMGFCSSIKTVGQDHDIQTLTEDGAWCWFSNPRAIYYDNEKIITGWVKKDGSVEIASLNITNGEKQFKNIFPKMEVDDHNNPAFTVMPSGNVMAMYTWHSSRKGVVSNTSSSGPDINSFGTNTVFKPTSPGLLERFPRETYTYANPYVLSDEDNKLFAFGRWTGYKPNLIISSDEGKTWEEKYVIISDDPFTNNNRPYVNYYSDGKSKIHMVFTDGHPAVEPLNSVYYCYYEKGAFWKIDGTRICTLAELPFTVEQASVVYKATETTGRAWIADIVVKDKVPVILYSRYPKETDHRYRYAWYNGKAQKWEDYEICEAGKWFPQTQPGKKEREKFYMGNMTLHPADPGQVYLSRQVNGRFEIEKFSTTDKGKSWERVPVTQNSEYDQVRPYIPRNPDNNSKTVVLWMENKKYIHFTDYDTQIKYLVED